MLSDDFDDLLRRRPFQPFRMHLSTGQSYVVRHPELAAVGRSVVWIDVPPPTSHLPVGERRVIVTLAHIVWIKFIEQPPAASHN